MGDKHGGFGAKIFSQFRDQGGQSCPFGQNLPGPGAGGKSHLSSNKPVVVQG